MKNGSVSYDTVRYTARNHTSGCRKRTNRSSRPSVLKLINEWLGVATNPFAFFQRLFGPDTGRDRRDRRDTGYAEITRGLPQSLQAFIWIVRRSRHDLFHPNTFQFIIILSSYHSTPICLPAKSVLK